MLEIKQVQYQASDRSIHFMDDLAHVPPMPARRLPPNLPEMFAWIARHCWQEISETEYFRLMGDVPPLQQHKDGFLISEESTHLPDGTPAFIACIERGDRYYQRILTESEYERLHDDPTQPDRVVDTIPQIYY